MLTSHWHAVLRIHLYLLSVANSRSDSSKNKLHLCFSGSPLLHCWLQPLTQIVMAESLPFSQIRLEDILECICPLHLTYIYHTMRSLYLAEKILFFFSFHPLNIEQYLGRSVQRQLSGSDCNLQQRNTAKFKPWSSRGRDKGDKCLDFPFLTFLLSCQCFLLSACIQGQEHTEEIYKSGSSRVHRMEEVRLWSHRDKWKTLS